MAEKKASQKQSSSKPAPTSKDSQQDKTKGNPKVKPAPEPKKKSGCLLYLVYFTLFLLVIAVIAGGVVAAANYLGFINLQTIKEDVGKKYELQKYPVIGQYFPPIETNFEPVPLAGVAGGDSASAKPDAQPPAGQTAAPALALPNAQTNVITPVDVAREEERNQAEFAKRVSRLARLYGEMKPANAAAVMKALDDETVLSIFSKMEDDQVAKILSVFETERAARLTEDMLRGRPY